MLIKDIALFAKIDPNSDAKIPTKREEDGAYDIYASFPEEYIIIEPFSCRLIPTGIASAFSNEYVAILRERGSTGIKNAKLNAGVMDSGYRDEWFIMIYNANEKPLLITKETDTKYLEDVYIVYSYNKAIAQFLFVPVPKVKIKEITYTELLKFESERMLGKLGSSNK
jgi:dUTP pyrophosphatase